MQVHVVTYSGDMPDEPTVLAVCSTEELAIARAEARAQEAFEEEPELSQDGWSMDTQNDVDYGDGSVHSFVALLSPDGFCTDVWSITEETVESQS